MKWFLVFILMRGEYPQIQAIAMLGDKRTCQIAAKVFQKESTEAARGRFTCMKLVAGKPVR
jgi:hypothetical protein